MRKSLNRVPKSLSRRNRAVSMALEPMEPRRLMSTVLGPVEPTTTGIETSGPYSTTYAPVNGGSNGTGSFGYQALNVFDFAPGSALFSTGAGSTFSNAQLQIYNTATTGNYAGRGSFAVYLLPASTATAPTGGLTFQASDPTGLNGQAGTGSNYLLGTFPAPTTVGYTTFNLSLPAGSAAEQAVAADLTGGMDLRLAITPTASTDAIDFEGDYYKDYPTLSITATAAPSEQFSAVNPSVNVDETSGQVIVDVQRTGYTTDAATVNYTASGGTAVAGTNYGSPTGTVSFAAGQMVAPLSIPITDAIPQGGNLTFNVTFSSPVDSAPAGSTVNATLGSQVTTQVTIVDAAPLTNNATAAATTATDVETSGPYTSTTYAPVNGSTANGTGSFGFQSFSVFEFTPSTSPSVFPGAGYNVSSLSNLSLSIENTQAAGNGSNFAAHPGDFQIYLLTDSETTTPTSALAYNTSAGPGGLGAQGTPALLGTFSFNGANANFDTYTPATLAASTASVLVSELDSQSPIRFAVTAGSSGFAADFEGIYPPYSPTLALTDTTVLAGNPETVAFDSSTYSNTSAYDNTVALTVDRSAAAGANLNDSETVNYSTSDGTAVAGTNYMSESGSVTFGPNQTSTTITVPVISVANQGGDKAFTVTLSDPTATGSSTQPILGQPSSAIVTVVDPTAGTRQTVTSTSSDQSSIQTSGPFASGDLYVTGTASTGSKYPSYGAVDFNNPLVSGPSGQDVYTFNAPVTQIDSLTLGVTATGVGIAGPINVYLVPDATSDISADGSSTHTFDVSALDSNGVPEGFGTQFDTASGTATLLGTINFDPTTFANESYTQVPLTGYSPAATNALIADLNNQTQFRIILAPATQTGYARFEGNYSSGAQAPTLTIGVNEGTTTSSSLPSYLAATSSATYVAGTGNGPGTLTVTGPTMFTADPGSAAPNVVASGSTAQISFNTTSGSNVHLNSLNLSNGAVAVENNPSTRPIVLEIASNGLSIDATSKLDIGTGDLDVAGGSLSAITALIARSYNVTGGANWSGTGITSSAAAADPKHLTAVGVASNAVLGDTTFDGDSSVGATDILVKYTYTGDANLSGKVDGSDYSLIDGGYGSKTASGWMNGDFNYEGTVDGSDYALIDNAFNNQLAPIGFTPSAMVATVDDAAALPSAAAPAAQQNVARQPALPQIAAVGPVKARSFFSNTPIQVTANSDLLKGKAGKSLAGSVVDSISASAQN